MSHTWCAASPIVTDSFLFHILYILITHMICSLILYSTYLLSLFHMVTFGFHVNCHQLNTLNHSLHAALQVCLLFIMQQEIEQTLL